MQVIGGQQGPPPALLPGHAPGHPQLVEGPRTRREDPESAVPAKDLLRLQRQRRHVEDHAYADQHRDQIEPSPNEALEPGAVAVETRIPRSTEWALRLAHRNELAAVRTDHRALGLSHGRGE